MKFRVKTHKVLNTLNHLYGNFKVVYADKYYLQVEFEDSSMEFVWNGAEFYGELRHYNSGVDEFCAWAYTPWDKKLNLFKYSVEEAEEFWHDAYDEYLKQQAELEEENLLVE